MGIRAGLGPRRGGGIRERLEVGLRGARAGAAATASLGDRGLEWIGLGGEDEEERKGEERWRRNSRRKGEREREILSKQGGEKEDEEQSDLLYFLFSF